MKLDHEVKVQEAAMEDNSIQCPQCDTVQDADLAFLGQLGWLTHYRCRYCGINFSESGLSRDIAALAEGDQLSREASYFTPDQGGQA